MTSRNTNQPVTPGASSALDQMKYEIASELGLANYQQMDKGSLPSRVNGYVGGNMTKKLVAYAEQALSSGNTAQILQAAPTEQIGQRS
ncbi:alpha/beta-type small acid-soluble spore protein [Desulforamulus hydrothermalis]|uniref:Small acid-soluble spore protein alpha/beta type n=1 Tax=Desulforamulus hydrothermalis Lam5 = DSM 18033 TaxID=1121428 RepID=K8DZ26_9FIRM|nr:alpha/beta-type small acid-soluble spore protein [Desulforamulus hydrothermalis]CCO08219.1 Small acid-soluble spore protein alpha/beta type [Desulforamulus hydrothermalis Lam5 = DSM 18033]SHH22194.1 Small, acid-soluble spore protein, alpha/beta type [Desulforamulus hydrothermalis Lam5 = DSM 18033]